MGMICVLVHRDSHRWSSWSWTLLLVRDHLFHIRVKLPPLVTISDVKLVVVWALGVNDDGALFELLQVAKNSGHPIHVSLSWCHGESAVGIDSAGNVKAAQRDQPIGASNEASVLGVVHLIEE